jgi:hypothetical protein
MWAKMRRQDAKFQMRADKNAGSFVDVQGRELLHIKITFGLGAGIWCRSALATRRPASTHLEL